MLHLLAALNSIYHMQGPSEASPAPQEAGDAAAPQADAAADQDQQMLNYRMPTPQNTYALLLTATLAFLEAALPETTMYRQVVKREQLQLVGPK